MPIINPDALKIGYVILIAGGKASVMNFQERAGYGESSRWTHVAGSLGGFDAIEGVTPRSRVINIQKQYIDRGIEIKVLRRKNQPDEKRYKIALWWATMNNLPYDTLQFLCFPLLMFYEKIKLAPRSFLSKKSRLLCSELIASGFYKEGDYLFNKPAEAVLPADFDNPELFEEASQIFLP